MANLRRTTKTPRTETNDDVFNLSLYAIEEQRVARAKRRPQRFAIKKTATIATPQHRAQSTGREALNRLIESDAATSALQPRAQALKEVPVYPRRPTAQPAALSNARPNRSRTMPRVYETVERHREPVSPYVIDLRKHYLIEKNRLNLIQQPTPSFAHNLWNYFARAQSIERVRWHIPKRTRAVQQREEPEDADDIDSSLTIRRMPALLTFSGVMLLVLLPISGVKYGQSLLSHSRLLLDESTTAVHSLTNGFSTLSATEYGDAASQLAEASKNFQTVQRSLNEYSPALQTAVAYIPAIGSKFELAKNLTTAGKHIANAGAILSSSLQTTKTAPPSAALLELSQNLEAAADALERSRVELRSLDTRLVPDQWRPSAELLRDNTDDIISSLKTLSRILMLAYHITGGEHFSRYLVVFQNNRELRATGGFIGSFARLDFSKGEVVAIDFPGGGAYDLEAGFQKHLIPPKPISILNNEWHLWDANWWPDFPTSAEKIAWFFEQASGQTVDGILAINSDIMPGLLAITGPIDLPEYGVTVDVDNFYQVIQQHVEEDYDKELNQPKKILASLYPLLIERLMADSNYQNLISVLTAALYNKDIQIAIFNNDDLSRHLATLGWDGAMKTNDKDYLSVISTNIAGGKSDASIFQTIDHVATVNESGEIFVTVKITKSHQADPSDPFAYVNNVDFTRIYVPEGSILLSANGFQPPDEALYAIPADFQQQDADLQRISQYFGADENSGTMIGRELGKTVFANWMQVAPGQVTSAVVTYKLPFHLNLKRIAGTKLLDLLGNGDGLIDSYSLLVQKQSGKRNTIINSEIQLPDPFNILWHESSDPEAFGVTSSIGVFSADLTRDIYYAMLIGSTGR